MVCYLYGYPVNNGYGMSFEGKDYKDAIMLTLENNLNFEVTRNGGVLYLKQIK